ncbi:MAG: hypothetical protein JW917_06425 [Ignavibacteria bacterium]|nr:hypothetical protein [Ignavibacteria bacterium]
MLKKIIIFAIASLVLVSLICQTDVQSQPLQRMKKGFYIGANGGYLYPEYFFMYKELGYNTTVDFGFQGDSQAPYVYDQNRIYGGFFEPASFYISSVTNMLTKWNEIMNSPNSVFLRSSKIDRPCFGQRSTYQVEDNAIMIKQKPGYGYVISETGQNATDSNVRVKCCIAGRDGKNKYIAKQLYENNEQTNVITRRDYGNAYYSDRKRIGDDFYWYVKPRMRIDSAFANNPGNRNIKVVRIEILNYDNVIVKTVDIYVDNFLDDKNHYGGNYLEMYNFSGQSRNPLSVSGNSIATDKIDTSAYYTPRELSKVDYRIFWYGEVNVWVDYVRLDDEWAHFLFTDDEYTEQTNNANRYKFHSKIRSEVENLSNLPGFGYFYFDEFYYNNIPCIKEVIRLIKLYNPNTGIIALSPPAGYEKTGQGAGIKNEMTLSALFDTLKNAGLFTDFVATDVYNIFDNSPIPPNLNKPKPAEFPGTVMYKKTSDAGEYNNNVNTVIFSESMRNLYKLCANVIKFNPDTKFVATIQAHTVESNFIFVPCGSIPDYERKREPTNEEIALQAYFAMAYGASQIHYFTHFSLRLTHPECNKYFYDWGLTTFETAGLQQRRVTNYYGQKKWEYIQKLNGNLMKIGNYMYLQNDLKYDNTITIEKSESYNYFLGLKSYYRYSSPPYEYSSANEDPANRRYWEIGFFNNPSESESKYFLLVNKRCTPEIYRGDGDFRTVRIYINSSALQGFNKWYIMNPVTNEKIVFDKNSIADGVNIPGEFLPGEGKIFKLAPVTE